MRKLIKLAKISLALFFTSVAFGQSPKISHDLERRCSVNSSYQLNEIDCDTFQFSATSSSGSSTNILGYYWTFGDGGEATGQNVSHSYSSNGTYTITLTTIGLNGSSCCSNTECFEVEVDCSVVSDDCGSLNGFQDVAGNDDCDVVLYFGFNDFMLDSGWTVIPNGYEWHLVNQNFNVDRYEYGAPPHTTDLTDNNVGPWTITLKVTAEDINGNLCVLEVTETLMSGCSQDLTNDSVVIYPNPTNNKINIENVNKESSIKIFNQSGTLVEEVNLSGKDDFSISVQGLKNGVYFLKVIQDNRVVKIEKFIKN